VPYSQRWCRVCHAGFTPPRSGGYLSRGTNNHLELCAGCRREALRAAENEAPPNDTATLHPSAADVAGAPLKQVVFDLETWGLDRGWGVTMVASFLIHGYPEGPRKHTLTLRDFSSWKAGRRSDDREFAEAVFEILTPCHVAYAHNGNRFDVPWLRTVALKFGLSMPKLKLIDPCQIAWKKYKLGRNSLEAVADFLGLEEKGKSKLHVSPETWRRALMDNSDADWEILKERCESDVDLLNEVSSRVTGDIGMIDTQGSWR
jgi:uncharacterized protein YprB with RNaseH-like and TPR domain